MCRSRSRCAELIALALLATSCTSANDPGAGSGSNVVASRPALQGLVPLLAEVPADAYAVLAFDLEKTRGSAALMSALDTALRQTGLAERIGPLRSVEAIAIVSRPAAPIALVRSREGVVRIVGDRRPPARGPALLADALVAAKSAPAGFAAIRFPDGVRASLAGLVPGLEKLQWAVGTLDTSSGIVLAGSAVFPDATSAAAVAVSVSMAKKLAKTQLPEAAGTALDKLAFTAMGNTVKISAYWTEADVAGAVAVTRD